MAGIDIALNELESRVAALEQVFANTVSGLADTTFDYENNLTVTNDPLDWSVANNGWESYSTLGPPITDPDDVYYPGGVVSTAYAMPAAYRLGGMCVLTGLVRRKAGAANLTAGTRYNSPMFALPQYWQPTASFIVPCLMGTAAPSGLGVVGTAWVEISEDPDTDTGVVSFVTGTVSCTNSTGWISLHGLFPIRVADSGPLIEGSWDDASGTTTWNMVDPTVTWNSYPDPAS
jgi:hypothetical protein